MTTPVTARISSAVWAITGLALTLSVISLASELIQNWINSAVFGGHRLLAAGWIYTLCRMPPSALLVWWIVRLPRAPVRHRAAGAAQRPTGFDPLMGLRAFACLFVILSHYFFWTMAAPGGSRGSRFLLSAPGPVGVWLFFVLSGFLMGKAFLGRRYALDDDGVREFLRNRMLRIAPIYYAGMLLVTTLRNASALQPQNLWGTLRILIFDYKGPPVGSPIPPLWSVSTEVQFYLLVPALVIALSAVARIMGRTFAVAPVLVLIGMTAVRLWCATYQPAWYSYWMYWPLLGNIDLFLAGLSLNFLPVVRIRRRRATGILLAVASGLFYRGANAGWLRVDEGGMGNLTWLAIAPICTAIFAAGFIYLGNALGSVEIRRTLTGGVLWLIQGMGTLTYCLYVFHIGVFLSAADAYPHRTFDRTIALFPLIAMEVLGVAIFFYTFVEKPFTARKRLPDTPLYDAP